MFDRLSERLRLNAGGEQLVLAAESIEDAVLTLEGRRRAESAKIHHGDTEDTE